jgi:hypothetical protein
MEQPSKSSGSKETDSLLAGPRGTAASELGSYGFDEPFSRTAESHRRHSSGETYGYGSTRSGVIADSGHDKLSLTPDAHRISGGHHAAMESSAIPGGGGKLGFYKNPHHLSESAFQTLTEGIVDQLARHRKINRYVYVHI